VIAEFVRSPCREQALAVVGLALVKIGQRHAEPPGDLRRFVEFVGEGPKRSDRQPD